METKSLLLQPWKIVLEKTLPVTPLPEIVVVIIDFDDHYHKMKSRIKLTLVKSIQYHKLQNKYTCICTLCYCDTSPVL